jgi:hypothetical protein
MIEIQWHTQSYAPRSMKNRVINLWKARVGTDGAVAYWHWLRWTVYGRWAFLVFILIFAVAAHFHSVLLEVAAYVFLAAVVVAVTKCQPKAKRRFRALASQALGVAVVRGNFPPRTDEQYAAWCAKNGIVPKNPVNMPKGSS